MQVDAEDCVEIDILGPACEHDGGQHWAPVSVLACNRLDKSTEHGSRLSIELRWRAVSVRVDMATLVWRPRGTGATAAPARDAAASGAESGRHAHDTTEAHDPSPGPAERRRAVLHTAAPRSGAAAAAAAPVATAMVAGAHPKQEPGTAGHHSAQPVHKVQHCSLAKELKNHQPSARASAAVAHASAAPGSSPTALPQLGNGLTPAVVDLTDEVPSAAALAGAAANDGSASGQGPQQARKQAPQQSSTSAAVQPGATRNGAVYARARSFAGAPQAVPTAEQAPHGALTQPAQPPSHTHGDTTAFATVAARSDVETQASKPPHESARAAVPNGGAFGVRAAEAPCVCCLDRARHVRGTSFRSRCSECERAVQKVNGVIPHATLSREALYSAVRCRRSTDAGYFASDAWTTLDAASAAEMLCALPCQPEGCEMHQELQAALCRLRTAAVQGAQAEQRRTPQHTQTQNKCSCCLSQDPPCHRKYCEACESVLGRIRRHTKQTRGCRFDYEAAIDVVRTKLLADVKFFRSVEWLQTPPKQAVPALCGAESFEPEGIFWDTQPDSAAGGPATAPQACAAAHAPRRKRVRPDPEPAAATGAASEPYAALGALPAGALRAGALPATRDGRPG